MTTEPTPTLEEYNPVAVQAEREIRDRPPMSVAFPGRTDCYIRFSTSDCVELCKELKVAGMKALVLLIDSFDIHALMLAFHKGLKLDEGAKKPLVEHMDFAEIQGLVLEGLTQRTWRKTIDEVAAEGAKRQADEVKALLG